MITDSNIPKTPGERDLPPRYRFYKEIEIAHELFAQQMKTAWQEAVEPESKEELDELITGITDFGIDFKDKKTPVSVDEADSADFNFLFSATTSGPHEPFSEIGVFLYRDGSPFMLEDDIENFPDQFRFAPMYKIIASSEFPPFLVLADKVLEGLTPTTDYLRYIREAGEKPRFLSDDECKSITDALKVQLIDPAETAAARLMSTSVYDHMHFTKS